MQSEKGIEEKEVNAPLLTLKDSQILVLKVCFYCRYVPGMEVTLSGRLKSLYSTHCKVSTQLPKTHVKVQHVVLSMSLNSLGRLYLWQRLQV
jgi:hypothetical protein